MTEAMPTIVQRLEKEIRHLQSGGAAGIVTALSLSKDAKSEITRLQSELNTALERVKELEEQISGLSNPVLVHANMLRGAIAKPSLPSFLHAMGGEILRSFQETVEIAQRNESSPSVDIARAVLQSSGK